MSPGWGSQCASGLPSYLYVRKIVAASFSEAQEHPLARKKSVGSSAWPQCSTIFPSEMRNMSVARTSTRLPAGVRPWKTCSFPATHPGIAAGHEERAASYVAMLRLAAIVL